MMTPEQFAQTLDELTQQLPAEFFERLNGGVAISPDAPLSADSNPARPRYTLGTYHHTRELGCWITLYYGSFCAVMGDMEDARLREEIDRVLRHELRHHMEDRAGLRDLIDEDTLAAREYAAGLFRE